MNILDRAKAPTPRFFRVLRAVGLSFAAAGAALVAAPIALPAAVVTVAGYLTVAGSVLAAVSQITVEDAAKQTPPEADDPADYYHLD